MEIVSVNRFFSLPLAAVAFVSVAALALTGCAAENTPAEESLRADAKTSATPKPAASAAHEFGTDAAIQEAVAHATTYARASHTNGYFLSGEWEAKGSSIDEMGNFLEEYYSAEEMKSVNSWKGKDLENQKFAEAMTPLMVFWGDTDNYKPYEKCTIKSPKLCILSLEQGKTTSNVDKAKKVVNVKFQQTTEFPLWSKEIDQTVKATGTWTYDLDVSPTENGGWEIVDHNIDGAFNALEPVNL